MGEMQIMNISGVDCYEDGGTAYIRLDDAVKGLGITQIKNGIPYIRWDRVEQYLKEVGFPHKWGKGDFIPENIFYRLAMKAKNAVAEAFQAKIADEVIPSIRKHGMYATPATIDNILNDPDFGIRLLEELKKERQEKAVLAAKIEDDKPKVEFADALLVCENCIYIEELAKLLCQIGMNTGRNRLFEEMTADGFLCIRDGVKNMPTQKCVENGWLVIEKKVFERNGKMMMGYTTKVTPKGIQYFIGYYKRKHGLEPVLTTSRRRVIEQRPAPRQLRAAHNQTDMR